MSARAVIVVSGFGRCGSSLVMQMLAAGGVRCLGNAPAYESFDRVEPGQAIKILDPQHDDPIPYAVPPGARVIWVDRDVEEQAASHARRWAPFIGLAGQPAWLWYAIDAHAPGVLVVSAAYTVVWLAGCVREVRR